MVENCIKEVRHKQGVTQRWLAEHTGLPDSTISDIETGKHAPTLKAALLISEALNVTVNELFSLNRKKQ